MFCSNCGSSLGDTAKFCGSCGTRVQAAPSAKTGLVMHTETPAQVQETVTPEMRETIAEETAVQEAVSSESAEQETAPLETLAETVEIDETVGDETVAIETAAAEPVADETAVPSSTVAPEPATMPIAQSAANPTPSPTAAVPPPITPPVAPSSPGAGTPGQTPQLVVILKRPGVARSIGTSFGIGIGAAVALALITSIFLAMLTTNSAAEEILNDLMDMDSLHEAGNFFAVAVFLLAWGMGGSLHVSASSALGSSMSSSVTLPVSLIGVALVVGAAFGAYHVARTRTIAYRWAGLGYSALVGLASATAVFALCILFSGKDSMSVFGVTAASYSITFATPRTFLMTFLLGTLGASAGYALAQYACDAPNVFAACWRWAHRARGWVRTVVDAVWIYTIWFGILLAVVTVLGILGDPESIPALLAFPILLPAGLCYLIAFVSGGSFTDMEETISLATLNGMASMDEDMEIMRNMMVMLLIIFAVATVYIGLRIAARNMYDPAYKGWQHSWKAPVAMLAIWFVAIFLFLPVHMEGDLMISPTYALIAAIWMFAAEAVALTFGEQAVRSMTSLWKILVNATVRPTPEPVVAHRIACGGPQRKTVLAAVTVTDPSTPAAATAASMDASVPSPVSAPATAPATPTASAAYSQTAVSEAPPSSVDAQPTIPIPVAAPTVMHATAAETGPDAAPTVSTPPIAQPAAAPTAAPVFSAESAPAVTKPMSAKQKRNIIIGCSIGAAIVALLITVSTLNATVFSPKSVAQEYLRALESGNYDQAQSIVSPQLTKDQSALLTSQAAHKTARISNVHITNTSSNGSNNKTVMFTYSLNGSSHDGSVTLINEGRKFGVFNNWEITQPLTHEITMNVPSIISSIKVNGVPVSQENAFRSSDDTWTFKVYPGAYEVTMDDSDYYNATPVTVYTADEENTSSLRVTPTSQLEDEINTQIAEELNTCAKSTDSKPEGCPFSYYTWSDSNTRNFSWKISQYPKVDDFNLSSGYFSTSQGSADVTFERRYSSSGKWEPDDSSSSFYLSGHFILNGDEIQITRLDY